MPVATETWNLSSATLSLADGTSVNTTGEVLVEPTGKVELRVQLHGVVRLEDFAEGQNITGQTVDGLSLVAQGAFASQANFESSTGASSVIFTPLECLLTRSGRTTWTRREVYLKSLQVLGRCRFQHNGTDFQLEALDNQNDHRPGLVRALLTLAPSANADHTDVLLLLSLAQRCLIQSPLQKDFDGDDLVRARLVPNELPYTAGNPLVPRSPRELASFITQVSPHFAAKSSSYELSRLIQYYCLSVSEPYGEIKFLLASVFMEALKFYWALNVGKETPVLKASGLIRGFQKATNAKGKPVLFEFEELLQKACSDIGYTTTFTFIEDRNAMFHSGAPGAYQAGASSTWSTIKPELIQLYRQIDDILLTILGYRGPIHRWDAPDIEVQFP